MNEYLQNTAIHAFAEYHLHQLDFEIVYLL